MKKLRGRKGESLVESLFSILIIAIAAALLATMVMVSININKKVAAASDALRGEMNSVESFTGTVNDNVQISIDGFTVTVQTVESASGGGDALRAYRWTP